MAHLFLIEHDRGVMPETALEGLTAARAVAEAAGDSLEAVIIGVDGHGLASEMAAYGVAKVHLVSHEMLTDYAPSAWGDALAQLAVINMAAAVSTTGTERGNEVMAHLGALLDMAMVSNCIEIDPSADDWEMTRVRWGGSLHETRRAVIIHQAGHAQSPLDGASSSPRTGRSHTRAV